MRLAFVTPRMGEEVVGGAEVLCLQTAARLRRAGIEVDLFSTTIADFHSSREAFPRGESLICGMRLTRFPPDPADIPAYLQRSGEIARGTGVSEDIEEEWLRNSLNSTALLDHLAERLDAYDSIVFFQYLRALCHRGIERFGRKAILCPTLHDEPFARMGVTKRMMNSAGGLVFLSEPEKQLAIRLYGLDGIPRTVTGLGFDPPAAIDRTFAPCSDPFLLYTGRIEPAKGVHRLVDFFVRYKSFHPGNIKLILCGDVQTALPRDDSLLVLGRLGDDELQRAYAAALATVQPSDLESFSISIFESWQQGRPVLVSRNCGVTREFCERSNGGLYFGDYYEFEACLDLFLSEPGTADRIGVQGREFVASEYNWDRVLSSWLDFFTSTAFHSRTSRTRLILLNTNLLPNDAVGNNLIEKARVVGDTGIRTRVLLESDAFPPADLQPCVLTLSDAGKQSFEASLWAADCYWIDYSVYYPLLKAALALKAKGKRVLFDYHGITPPALWDDPETRVALEQAVANLPVITEGDAVVCHSSYTRLELEKHGIPPERIQVFPYAVPVDEFFPTDKDRELMDAYGLDDSDFVLLYVGRMAGNKRIDVLTRALGIASGKCPQLRLMLVGDTSLPAYQRQVDKAKDVAREYAVEDRVIFTGVVPELRKYFNLADVFVTSSIHEGFCVPAIEAMACGKPVIATRSTALPETVGEAGILFEPDDAEQLAAEILKLKEDPELHDRLATAGVRRACLFDLAHYRRNVRSFLERVLP